jgi:patatin-like phospholipase/acyl hydrolase
MEERKKLKILSIDGGGLRGLVPLQIIKHIETITGEEIHKSFDLIAGTSTGGLLACALTFPDFEGIDGDKRKYSLDDIEKIYTKKGSEIFPKTNKVRNLISWISPKFSPTNLEKILHDYFNDARITNCLRPIFITSYNIHRSKPIFFTTREASSFPEKNSKLVDICRSTSAAPTYFPSYDFSYGKENIVCIDGGIFMNNPALGSLIEVVNNSESKFYKKNDKLRLEDIFILSLGTGYTDQIINSHGSKKWGKLKWIQPVIDLTMNGPINVIDSQMMALFDFLKSKNNYLRININIKKEFSEMSDSRDEVTEYLIQETSSQILRNDTLKRAQTKLSHS